MTGSGDVWATRAIDWAAIAALGAAAAVALAIALLPLTWAFLLVFGGIAVAGTLLRPQFGLLLILAAVPFGSLRQMQVGVMSVGATEVLVALLLAAWLMRMIAHREVRIGLPWLGVPLLLFLGAMLVSLLITTSLEYSLKEIVKWVEVLAIYLFVTHEVDERWARLLVMALLGIGAVAALQGIYQFLFQVGPEGFILFDRFMRAYGTFEQPNPYGGYLGLTLPLSLGLVTAGVVRLRSRRPDGPASGTASFAVGERIKGWWLVWAGGCGALMLAALVMSWSRGAWLGVAAGVAVIGVAVLARSSRAAVLAVVLVALVAPPVLLAVGLGRIGLPSSIVQRLSDFVPYLSVEDVRGVEITDSNYAVLERMAHWQAAVGMWTDHPWLGVGIGNYEPVYPRYALPFWSVPLGHAHNYYLNIAAETGIVGLAAYVLLWAVALLGAWRAAHRASGWQAGVSLGILGMMLHLSVHNLVDNLYVHGMYLQLAILLGMVPFLTRRSDRPDAHRHGP